MEAIPDNRSRLFWLSVLALFTVNSQPAPIGRWVATTGKIVKGPLGPADHVRRDEGRFCRWWRPSGQSALVGNLTIART
jgi:hypothetical protein